MSANKLRSLLLVTALGVGVGQSYAATTLNVWIRASNDSKNIYKQEAEKFEENTGIKIEYFNATTDFEQRLARATAGNALPDLIFNDAASLGQFIQLGIAEEIDPSGIKGVTSCIRPPGTVPAISTANTMAFQHPRKPSRYLCARTGARN